MGLVLKLTEHEAQIVLNALIKEPYVNVVDVINNIQAQASEQMNLPKNSFYAEPMEGQGLGV